MTLRNVSLHGVEFLNFKFEYLHENEFLRKNNLACLSETQMGLINEKNWGRKSRDTAPLKLWETVTFYRRCPCIIVDFADAVCTLSGGVIQYTYITSTYRYINYNNNNNNKNNVYSRSRTLIARTKQEMSQIFTVDNIHQSKIVW